MASSSSNTTNLMQGLDSKSRALIGKIVAHLKCQGNFDELRRDYLEELDKMDAFRQLNQRVESYVATFLSKQEWSDSLSKNQMRDSLRKHVCASDALKTGAQRLVTQVIEKNSRAFQTSLESIVQNFIYMDKEQEKQDRQARYYSRYGGQQECSTSTSKAEYGNKASTSEKSSAISDVNDIISQIEQEEVETTSKSEASSSATRTDSMPSSQQSTTSTSSKSDSTLSKQKSVGIQSKIEQVKHEKKADNASFHETPPSKSNPAKRINQVKRVIPKIGTSPNPSSPSDKPTESPPRSKPPKSNPTVSNSDCLPDKLEIGMVKDPSKMDTVAVSVDPDVTQSVAVAHESTLKTCQDGTKSSEHCAIGVVQKHEEKNDTNTIKDDTKPVILMETEEEEKPVMESEAKIHVEIKEETAKLDSIELEQEQPKEDQDTETIVACNFDSSDNSRGNKDIVQESDSEESVSDVSSVHTSDLSSFDGEVSSVSDSSGDNDEGEDQKSHSDQKEVKKDSKQKTNSNKNESQSGKTSEARSLRRPRRSAEALPKRKRGRPKKEDRNTVAGEHVSRYSRSKHEGHKRSSDATLHTRDKSKRTIKKKRCYSPSSEGTREVCLPTKRSRVNSRD